MSDERPRDLIEGSGHRGQPKYLASSLGDEGDLKAWIEAELAELRQRGIIEPGYTLDYTWDPDTSTLHATVKVTVVLPDTEGESP